MGRFLLGFIIVAASFQAASAQTPTPSPVATDPVGFLALNIQGTGGSSSSALSFLGLSFTQPVAYQATLSSASGTTLTDSKASWTATANGFNGTTGAFYIELLTGSGAGMWSNITAAGTNTITTAQDLSSYVTAGTGYKIRPNWTLATVFGATDQAGLFGGTASTADQILVYSPATSSYTTYFYQTSGIGATGWRKVGDGTHADQSNAYFNPTDGILVKRQQSSNVSFSLAGAVKLGQTVLPVVPGLNILSNVYPSGNFTLGTSGLQASGLGGGTASTADLVEIYNSATGSYSIYFYQTSGIGGTGWRLVGDGTHSDQSGAAIPFGQGLIIQRKVASAFSWVAPQPF